MKVKVEVKKVRTFWVAKVVEDSLNSITGFGSTREKAVEDLKQSLQCKGLSGFMEIL